MSDEKISELDRAVRQELSRRAKHATRIRNEKLSPEQRKEISVIANQARWGTKARPRRKGDKHSRARKSAA